MGHLSAGIHSNAAWHGGLPSWLCQGPPEGGHAGGPFTQHWLMRTNTYWLAETTATDKWRSGYFN